MPRTPTLDDIELIIDSGKGSGAPPPAGGDDDAGKRPGPQPATSRRYYTGVMLAMVAILMFFMALTSSFIVRKGLGGDWQSIPLPPVLWVNTGILLISSFTVELARRRLAAVNSMGFRLWWAATTTLGLAFLAGQLLAWRQLVAAGAFLKTNPSSSFFYTLTASHGAHLIGGIVALLYVAARSFEHARVTRAVAAEVASIYWHFMDGLWIFLILLLYLGR